MNKSYTAYVLYKVVSQVYEIDAKKDFGFVLRLIDDYKFKKKTEEQVINEFTEYINGLTKKENNKTSEYKTRYITDTIEITPTSILDIGAGGGQILKGVGDHFNVQKDKMFALDLQPIENDAVTVISYTEDMRIPLEDNSIDLVIMLSLLHHVPPDARHSLLDEVHRVLSPNGRVIIREHDNDKSRAFYIFLQLVHYVWYIHNNENKDDLILMTRNEANDLFTQHGFKSCKAILFEGSNLQRIYGEIYKKN